MRFSNDVQISSSPLFWLAHSTITQHESPDSNLSTNWTLAYMEERTWDRQRGTLAGLAVAENEIEGGAAAKGSGDKAGAWWNSGHGGARRSHLAVVASCVGDRELRRCHGDSKNKVDEKGKGGKLAMESWKKGSRYSIRKKNTRVGLKCYHEREEHDICKVRLNPKRWF